MSMRIFSLAVLFFVTACGGSSQTSEPEGERIACALDGAAGFAQACTLERNGSQLVVYRPDGGFRRFADEDGRVRAIDGADELVQSDSIGQSEIAVGNDRYRIPRGDEPDGAYD